MALLVMGWAYSKQAEQRRQQNNILLKMFRRRMCRMSGRLSIADTYLQSISSIRAQWKALMELK
jgi:hypothetical protein